MYVFRLLAQLLPIFQFSFHTGELTSSVAENLEHLTNTVVEITSRTF